MVTQLFSEGEAVISTSTKCQNVYLTEWIPASPHLSLCQTGCIWLIVCLICPSVCRGQEAALPSWVVEVFHDVKRLNPKVSQKKGNFSSCHSSRYRFNVFPVARRKVCLVCLRLAWWAWLTDISQTLSDKHGVVALISNSGITTPFPKSKIDVTAAKCIFFYSRKKK